MVIEHASKPAEKIRISGGGRCNFTNLHASPQQYLSRNPRFCISALSRYSAQDFISLVEKHGIAYHEKTLGQLFCDGSSQQIIAMLLRECSDNNVTIQLQNSIEEISKPDDQFLVRTSSGEFACESVVVACGGLSIPKMGATGFGYNLARQFGLAVVPTRAALVPFTLAETDLRLWSTLSGVAVQAEVRCGRQRFREGILFTHRGLSGPAMLQISSYWQPKETLRVNLAPECDVNVTLKREKETNGKQNASAALGAILPKRLAYLIAEQHLPGGDVARLADAPDRLLEQLGSAVNDWRIVPHGTEGYRTAEVTLGGVDTSELSSQTMMSRKVEGLYFVGEVVDVTGHLGGFNFQWAWASGFAAGQYV